MILSGLEIKKRSGSEIIIEPFYERYINPNSYNLRLHNELLIYEDEILDMKKPNKTRSIIIPEEGLVLEPGRLYLGRTLEYIKTEMGWMLKAAFDWIQSLGYVHTMNSYIS